MRAIIETKNIEDLRENQIRLNVEKTKPVRTRERSWFEKFHCVKSSDGFLIIGGRMPPQMRDIDKEIFGDKWFSF